MFVNYGLAIFLTPYLITKLGDEIYSLWLLSFSIISYLSLSNLGFGNVFLVELPKKIGKRGEEEVFFNTFFFSYLSFSLLSFIAFIGIYHLFDSFFKMSNNSLEVARRVLPIFFGIFLLQFFQGLFDSIVYVSDKLFLKNAIETFKVIIIGCFTYILLHLGYGIYEVALLNLFVQLLAFMLMAILARKEMKYSISINKFDITLFKESLSPSWHYFIFILCSQVIFYSDTWLISGLAGVKYVAAYALMYRLVDVFVKAVFKIADAKHPKILALCAREDYNALKQLHWKLQRLNFVITFPIAAALAFAGIYILQVWLGKALVFDQTILTIFCLLFILHTVGHVSALFVLALGIHRVTSRATVLEAASNLLLSFLFYKQFGILGIALGTLLSNLCVSFWFVPYQFLTYINSKITSSRGLS